MTQSEGILVSLSGSNVSRGHGFHAGNRGVYETSIGNIVLVQLVGYPFEEILIYGQHVEYTKNTDNGTDRLTYRIHPILDEEVQGTVIEDLKRRGFKGEFIFYDPSTTLIPDY